MTSPFLMLNRILTLVVVILAGVWLIQPDAINLSVPREAIVLALTLAALLLSFVRSKSSVVSTEPVVSVAQASELAALKQQLVELGSERDRLKKKLLEDEKAARERLATAGRDDVLALLSLLQEKGRFLDFVMDDVAPYTDQQIGSAARVVHSGCSSVIREYFRIGPVVDDREGGKATIERDVDSGRYRLMGKLSGEPPFTGTVIHRGWQANEVRLPERIGKVGASMDIIVPAEIEIS